eukprot:5499171-Alexandrium_andersonii.AAC.1
MQELSNFRRFLLLCSPPAVSRRSAPAIGSVGGAFRRLQPPVESAQQRPTAATAADRCRLLPTTAE